MICRTCLRRATGALARPIVPARSFSLSLRARNAAAPAATTTDDLTPITPNAATEKEPKAPLSSCPAGTVLTGLNYFKGKAELVAKPDEDYPEWLWRCLEVTEKGGESADAGAGDEFSKSKKQRRIAMKRQRKLEAAILESGDLESLAPKIPLQQQSINLPGKEDGGLDNALLAADKRDELRVAMRKERRAKIKESNYLKSM